MDEHHKNPVYNLNLSIEDFVQKHGEIIKIIRRNPSSPFSTMFELYLDIISLIVNGAGYSFKKGHVVRILFPSEYPCCPPLVFAPGLFHPNVSNNLAGVLCYVPSGEWRPSITIPSIIIGIIDILTGKSFDSFKLDPFPKDEICVKAAKVFQEFEKQGKLPFGIET
jgi:hypothetical protein